MKEMSNIYASRQLEAGEFLASGTQAKKVFMLSTCMYARLQAAKTEGFFEFSFIYLDAIHSIRHSWDDKL